VDKAKSRIIEKEEEKQKAEGHRCASRSCSSFGSVDSTKTVPGTEKRMLTYRENAKKQAILSRLFCNSRRNAERRGGGGDRWEAEPGEPQNETRDSHHPDKSVLYVMM